VSASRVRCFLEEALEGTVKVRCKYIRWPLENDLVKFKGNFVKGDAEPLGDSLKLTSHIGEVILEGKGGTEGFLGSYGFTYQYIDVNAIGLKDRFTVIIHIIGKGVFRGTVYGYSIEGLSQGDELIGVPFIRGNKAKVNIGGLWLVKELPRPYDLKSYDIPLPYTVVEVNDHCKKIVAFEDMEAIDVHGKIWKIKKGANEICDDSILYYKGFVEKPERAIYVKSSNIISTRVSKFEYKGSYLYLRTPLRTIIVDDEGVSVQPLDVYCKGDNIEVEVRDTVAYIKDNGVSFKVRLPARPSSCEVSGKNVMFTFPSAPLSNLLRLTEPSSIFIPLPSLSHIDPPRWKEEWGEGASARILLLNGKRTVELEPGIFKLLRLRRFGMIIAYNLYGSVYLLDDKLNVLWSREAHAIRSVTETEIGFALWTQRPPRIRFYMITKKGIKEIKKIQFGLNHVALCSNGKLVYAIDEYGKVKVFDSMGKQLLRGKVEPAWACLSKDDVLLLLNEDGVSKWKVLSSVKDWNQLYHIAISQNLPL